MAGLVPVELSVISHHDLIAGFKKQRPAALNEAGALRKEEFLNLLVTMLVSRVQTGVDIAHAAKWSTRYNLLKHHVRQAGYKYQFPNPRDLRKVVELKLKQTHPDQVFIFNWKDYSSAVLATLPDILNNTPNNDMIISRLLSSSSPIATLTALKLQETSQGSIVQLLRGARQRAQDYISQRSDKLITLDVERIQTNFLLACDHARYAVKQPQEEAAPSDLLLIEKIDEKEDDDADPYVALQFEIKASASSSVNGSSRTTTISRIFNKNFPVIADFFQSRDGVRRFYACLVVREPTKLREALKQTPSHKQDHLVVSFRATHAAEDPFYFQSVTFRGKFSRVVLGVPDCEFRYLGDAFGSTSATLQDPYWKISTLVSWIPSNTRQVRLSEIRCTGETRAHWGRNKTRARAVMGSHPHVSFHPRLGHEHFRVQFETDIWTVFVKTARFVPEKDSFRAFSRVGKKPLTQTGEFACELFCCVDKTANCFFFSQEDDPFAAALGHKQMFTWKDGDLNRLKIEVGELDKIAQLFARCRRAKQQQQQQLNNA